MDPTGANYDGKGLIIGHIARDYGLHVRVGAANAGHTVYTRHEAGKQGIDSVVQLDKHVVQQIPVAAYANPDAVLAIGPGAQISPEIFAKEIEDNTRWRSRHGYDPMDLRVDPRAHVITDEHVEREQSSGLDERIGSTSTIAKEGIGSAQAARVMRDESCVLWKDFQSDWVRNGYWPQVGCSDVAEEIYGAWHDCGIPVLLEGTQGTGLSVTTGQFPYVTSRNTTASGLIADCGVGPTAVERVIVVARTYPIRVAGNSGPFYPDSDEIRWSDIGVDEDSERTTVTKKVRRVATFSVEQVRDAAMLNGATEIALTFSDYLHKGIAFKNGPHRKDSVGDANLREMIRKIEEASGVGVTMLGTSPHDVVDLVP